ncbi:glycosyltransferase family 4 protein [Pontimicrobium sp. SW4]|uniref:Glycosyltransferase family 4 protein n=1 Tax=Pontimicrobium sp. SW4 TaxID=3153519 RepID=A0AAU7BUP9_9FLAO
MSKSLKILVSSAKIPTNGIGSWTTRISKLNANTTFFDYILSPSSYNEKYLNCKKRKFIIWRKEVRGLNLKFWVAKDYIHKIKLLSKRANKITVVVMDDAHLLEAITLTKNSYKCPIEIVFSFHGFELNLKKEILHKVDKILFLSQLGYEFSKEKYPQKFPKVKVVGNGVDSNTFFPLDEKKIIKQREEKGYVSNDEILIWVANDRPKKGIHIFHKIIEELLKNHRDLKVIIVGSNSIYNHPRVNNIGRISNEEVATYLKISNYYMFTTFYNEGFGLSMVEALKCGNAVIASNKGAIPEVLNGLDRVYLVERVNDIENWIEAFNLARKDTNFGKIRPNKTMTSKIWDYNDWEKKFIKAISES